MKKSMILIIICLLSGRIMSGQSIQSLVKIIEPPPNGIVLEQYSEMKAPEFAKVFASPPMKSLDRFAFVLTNESDKDLLGLAIRWVVPSEAGKNLITDYETDSYFLSRTPVLKKHGRLLIVPGMLIPQSQYYTGTGVDTVLVAQLRDSSAPGVYLDLVIFEDGTVMGQDQAHMVANIVARSEAAHLIASVIADEIAKGNDARNALAAIAGARTSPQNLVEVWKQRIARRTLNSPDIASYARSLQSLQAPDLHVKSEGLQ